ncbi:hypothetical protein BC628DRAFT_1028921 [Trametes gibbosa]|nr:hypothetical protein BC628DRAFT_1028921 [Trametes gibbosa]
MQPFHDPTDNSESSRVPYFRTPRKLKTKKQSTAGVWTVVPQGDVRKCYRVSKDKDEFIWHPHIEAVLIEER